MKSGIMSWVSHSNMPILSVDVQPNGFRFVTGGSDHKVCIWNLLPAISLKYENPPALWRQDQSHKDDGNGGASNNLSVIQEEESKQAANLHNMQGDEVMREDNSQEDNDNDESVDTQTHWQNYDSALKVEDEEGFESDVKLMEELFENPKKRYQKLLAVVDNHNSPVNCVRWNLIGTLFASAADDGTINLMEYVGELAGEAQSDFQKYQFNTQTNDTSSQQRFGMMPPGGAQQVVEESKGEVSRQEENAFEQWRSKRTWHLHRGGVSDLAWSPDNIHLASCATDSQIIIWNINEASPIRMIEAKANGITFDPFGKFMATQSSEERSLTIWRIQQDFKNITKECLHQSYYKQSQSMSLFRRLSWSADGQFISTTAGKVGGMHTAPLIQRSSWRLAATLAGHNKTITSSRINPRLYRDTDHNSEEGLSCCSIVAIASIDSTISVWKPGMDKPLTVMMDVFHMGISDLSWGFNGNILLASAHDGKIALLHYQPGRLGQPLSELEKQLIIEQRYGTSILSEYKARTRLLQNNNMTSVTTTQASSNGQKQEQKTTVLNGKKKIVPITTMQYQVSQNINPYINPFQDRLLKDDTASTFTGGSHQGKPSTQSFSHGFTSTLPELSFQFPQANKPSVTPISTTVVDPTSSTPSLAIPPAQVSSSASTSFPNPQIVVPIPANSVANTLISLVDAPPPTLPHQTQQLVNIDKQLSTTAASAAAVTENNEEVKRGDEGSAGILEGSAKKNKKSKKIRKDGEMMQGVTGANGNNQMNNNQMTQQMGTSTQAVINMSSQIIGQQRDQAKTSTISQGTLQALQKEQYANLERMLLDPSSNNAQQQQVTVMSMEDYQVHSSVQGKEEMQLVLPSRDIFSDEIRILISNQDIQNTANVFARRRSADIRTYSGSENLLVDRKMLDGEFIVQTSVCGTFFILYTSRGQLNIFSTRSIQPIKQGLMMEGACFIESNEEAQGFAVLTIKGLLSFYRVKSFGEVMIGYSSQPESCVIEWQASLIDILKQKMSAETSLDQVDLSASSTTAPKISVRYLKLLNDTSVLVFLSDNTVFEYDPRLRSWRQAPLSLNSASQLPDQLRSLSSNNQHLSNPLSSTLPHLKDLSSIISQLERQTNLDAVAQQNSDNDHDMMPGSSGVIVTSRQVDAYARVNELQESLQLYDRLQMRNEFLYTLRMYTLSLLQVGDMMRLRDMLTEYKFILSWEDERQVEISKNQYKVSQESAYGHIMQLVAKAESDNDEMEEIKGGNNGGNQGTGNKVIEKPHQSICGGLEKSFVFQQAILPVIKTICQQMNCEIRDYVAQIISIIYGNQPSHQQQHHLQNQPVVQHLPSIQTVTAAIQQHHASLEQHSSPQLGYSQHSATTAHFQAPQVQPPLPTQLPSISNVLNAALLKASPVGSGSSLQGTNTNNNIPSTTKSTYPHNF